MESLGSLCEQFSNSSLTNQQEVFSHLLNDEQMLISQANEISLALVTNLPASERLYSIVCQVIAELSKQEEARNILSKYDELYQFLDASLKVPDSQLQGCRALGNLCFENEVARSAFLPFLTSDGGLASVVDRACSAVTNSVSDYSELARLKHVCSGLVLNLCNCHALALSRCIDLGLVQLLIEAAAISPSADHISFVKHTVVICSFLCDDKERCPVLMSTRLVDLLNRALVDGEREDDLLEATLECLADWCRNEAEASCALASSGVCEHLCRLAESVHVKFASVKAIGDVLIAIVGCDRAMPVLYRKGEGDVFGAMRRWASFVPVKVPAAETISGDTEPNTAGDTRSRRTFLATVGLFCLVNFAVNDTHSLSMVSAGVHRDVLAHLSPSTLAASSTDEQNDFTSTSSSTATTSSDAVSDLQRLSGALSALRNLCIPGRNQHQLRAESVQRLLQLWPTAQLQQQPALMFKYYAVLRLLTDTAGETARSLLAESYLTGSALAENQRPLPTPASQQAVSVLSPDGASVLDGDRAPSVLSTITGHALEPSVSGVHLEARRLLARIVRSLASSHEGDVVRSGADDVLLDGGGVVRGCGDGGGGVVRGDDGDVIRADGGVLSADGDVLRGGNVLCAASHHLLRCLAADLSVLSALVKLSVGADEGGVTIVGGAQQTEVVVNEALVALTLLAPFIADRQRVEECGLAGCCWAGEKGDEQPETVANRASLRRVLEARFGEGGDGKLEHSQTEQ